MDHNIITIFTFFYVKHCLMVILHLVPFAGNKSVKWTLRIASVHGQRAPLPFLKTVEVRSNLMMKMGSQITELKKS